MDDVIPEICISFWTKLEDTTKHVPSNQIVIKTNLGRYGLSELINKLLDHEQPIPFDFLIDDVFFRDIDLGHYLKRNNITSETILELEYVYALNQMQPQDMDECDDWVSALFIHDERIFASSYDSHLRVYGVGDLSQQEKICIDPDQCSPIRAMTLKDNQLIFGMDNGMLRFLDLKEGAEFSNMIGYMKLDANQRVSSLLVLDSISLLLCGLSDGQILIYDLQNVDLRETKKKKRKADVTETQVSLNLRISITYHSDRITGLASINNQRDLVLSASVDNTLRICDVLSGEQIVSFSPNSRNFAQSITGIALNSNNEIALGSEDGRVSIFTLEKPDDLKNTPLKCSASWKAHKRLVSQVKWTSDGRILTAGYDCSCKIFDYRSPHLPVSSVDVLGRPEPKLIDDIIEEGGDPSNGVKPKKEAKEDRDLDEIKVICVQPRIVHINGGEPSTCFISGSSDGIVRFHKL